MNSSEEDLKLVHDLNSNFTKSVLPVTVFVGIELVTGFIGNILVLLVVYLYYKVSAFKCFVLCLAVIDIFCCCITMSGEIHSQLNWYIYNSKGFCKFKSFFNLFTVVAETLCLLTIALYRYRKVCQPHSWQINRTRAKNWCFLLFLVAFVFSCPILFLWGTRSGKKVPYTVCEKDEKFDQTNYPLIHLASVALIVFCMLIVMLLMYIVVAKTLCTSKISRANSEEKMIKQQKNGKVPTLEGAVEFRPGSTNIETTDTGSENDQVRSDTDVKLEYAMKDGCNDSKPQEKRPAKTAKEINTFASNVRRKTLIMFILTVIFIITVFIYFVLITIVASSKDILESLSDNTKAVYFFFLRLYFVNHSINPFVYGFMDPKFKAGVKSLRKAIAVKVF